MQRFIEYLLAAVLAIAGATILGLLLKIFGIAFGAPASPIYVDLSPAHSMAVILMGAIIVAVIVLILGEYVPNVILEGDEE